MKMNKKTREYILSDMYRYFEGKSIPLKYKLLMPLEMKYLITFRKAQFANSKIMSSYYKLKLMKISRKSMIQIPATTKIGKGFYIGHCGAIVINSNVIMGENINIAHGVTIGQTNRGQKKGTPTIGNKVWIGTNAVVVGKITIGDNVLIAPNAYVNFDVPCNAMVLGNPAKIYLIEDATIGYIEKTI